MTCYNCHFESEIKFDKKIPYAPFHGWIFLMNFRGKVHAANLMALEYKDKTFIALAPHSAHTINPKGRACEDCHQNSAVREYTEKGTITAVRWDETDKRLVNLFCDLDNDFGVCLYFYKPTEAGGLPCGGSAA